MKDEIRKKTCKPPWAYRRLCISKSIVGTMFPLESYDNCMDSVETPKTVVLQKEGTKTRIKRYADVGFPFSAMNAVRGYIKKH